MQIKLIETIQYRSATLEAGAILDLPEHEAAPLVAAGHAEALVAPVPAVAASKVTKKES